MNIDKRIKALGFDELKNEYYIEMDDTNPRSENINNLKKYLSNKLNISEAKIDLKWEKRYSGVCGIFIEDDLLYIPYSEMELLGFKPMICGNHDNLITKAMKSRESDFLVLTKNGKSSFSNWMKSLFLNYPDVEFDFVNTMDKTYIIADYFNKELYLGFEISDIDTKFKCKVSRFKKDISLYEDENDYLRKLELSKKNSDIIIFT